MLEEGDGGRWWVLVGDGGWVGGSWCGGGGARGPWQCVSLATEARNAVCVRTRAPGAHLCGHRQRLVHARQQRHARAAAAAAAARRGCRLWQARQQVVDVRRCCGERALVAREVDERALALQQEGADRLQVRLRVCVCVCGARACVCVCVCVSRGLLAGCLHGGGLCCMHASDAPCMSPSRPCAPRRSPASTPAHTQHTHPTHTHTHTHTHAHTQAHTRTHACTPARRPSPPPRACPGRG
jgi:hypothetical protein